MKVLTGQCLQGEEFKIIIQETKAHVKTLNDKQLTNCFHSFQVRLQPTDEFL